MHSYLLAILTFCLTATNALDRPVVNTPHGPVRGTYLKSYEGRTYANFEGIPYAEPPLGNLRFADPQPVQPWSGIWEANLTTYCIQIMHAPEPEGGYLTGEEDCLYLNVYVPQIPNLQKNPLDVIVHFHGGAFMFGAGTTYAGPAYIMDKDVVFVTLNYRLGPFGFLSTEDDVVPGNLGMKDQVMALKWIQDNIKYFGGNSESVTITGLSAGGASVHFHYLSPLSKGLFHKGISTSGTALCAWTMQEAALEKAKKLATIVGCPTTNNLDMVNCLKQRPAKQLTEAIKEFRPWLVNPFSPFGLVVEKKSKNSFLSEHPYQILVKGGAHDLPWITSVTSDEGLYPAADYVVKENYLPFLEKNWNKLAPHILDYNYTIPDKYKDEISQKIKQYYLQDKIISRKSFNELVQLMGDRLFIVDAEKAARLQAQRNKSPVYFYYFSYHGEERASIVSLITHYESKYGISHGDDMMYVFTIENPLLKLTQEDEDMKNILLDMWSSFAKTGTPSIKNVNWETVINNADGKLNYLHIKSPKKIIPEEAKEMGHRSFWESISFMENENLFVNRIQDEL